MLVDDDGRVWLYSGFATKVPFVASRRHDLRNDGGVGDLYLHGNEDESHGNNYLGNTHGGLLHIGEDWYIFYHRQPNRSSYARQACAEKLERTLDGGFLQAEVTSCGLNGGPLPGTGEHEARIACNLWAKGHEAGRVDGFGEKRLQNHPYFTRSGKDREDNGDQYIANMHDGATAGFKYFRFDGTQTRLTVNGRGQGQFLVSNGERVLGKVPVNGTANTDFPAGVHPLFFTYEGTDAGAFVSFTIA